MKIWLLKRMGSVGWDEYLGFVISAPSPSEARAEAARVSDEEWWLDPKRTSCESVGVRNSNSTKIILSSFNAG
jgi:hypothetical protein